jgi:hypothetical protein
MPGEGALMPTVTPRTGMLLNETGTGKQKILGTAEMAVTQRTYEIPEI